MNVPWDAVGAAGVAVVVAAAPVFALARLAQRAVSQWWANRCAARETARFMKGLDLDLALVQLFVEEGCYFGEPDDLMALADEVFGEGDR